MNLLLKCLAAWLVCMTPILAAATEPSDDCDGMLTPKQQIEADLKHALALVGVKADRVVLPVELKPEVKNVTYDLADYIEKVGLGEQFSKALPIRSEKDLFSPINGQSFVKRSMGQYPFESFAISPTGQLIAINFSATYFPDDTYKIRSGHVFVASLNPEGLKVQPVAEIVLPNKADGVNSNFYGGHQFLCIEGVWTNDQDQLRSDLFFYSLRGKSPELVSTLSKKLGHEIRRVTEIDSPDRMNQFYFVEFKLNEKESGHLVLKLGRADGEAKILAKVKLPYEVASAIEQMGYDDVRRGYVRELSDRLIFTSTSDQVTLTENGGYESRRIDRNYRDYSRSSGSAWLMASEARDGHGLSVLNEVTGDRQFFQTPILVPGSLTQMNGPIIYSERHHPNYAEFVLWPNGTATVLTRERLVHSDFHANLMAGVSQAKGQSAKIELFFFE